MPDDPTPDQPDQPTDGGGDGVIDNPDAVVTDGDLDGDGLPDAFDDEDFEPFDPEAPLRQLGSDSVIRGIDWRGVLPWVRIFSAARLAAAPAKLLLALVGIGLLYTAGQAMDGLWYVLPFDRAVPNEVQLYAAWQDEPTGDFDAIVARQRETIEQSFDAARRRAAKPGVDYQTLDLGDVKDEILARRAAAVEAAAEQYEQRQRALAPDTDGYDRRLADLRRDRDVAIRSAYAEAVRDFERAQAVKGTGPFKAFLDHTVTQLNLIVAAVLSLNLLAVPGVLYDLLITGPAWAVSRHPVYFALFFPLLLVISSVVGGAICRIAAMEFARDEQIGVREGLRFSAAKFVSFLSAPLIPLLMLLVVGLAVSVGGALLNVPVVGPIVVGAGFFLALLGGLVVTLVVIGLIGGFNLMYPCVAAEGSDSFDAVARSFSYLYNKPWRLLFYTAVALVFGSLAYTAAHVFTWLVLRSAHFFAGLLSFRDAASGEDLLPALWTDDVNFGELSYDISFLSLNGGQDLAAFFIAFWVYLAIALLGAFAVSLYFCSGTILYFLMRRDVDATEYDEVYNDHIPGE